MFAAGGIATPADAALMMQLGCDGVFVGSGIVSIHVEQMRSDTPANRTLIIPNPYVFPSSPLETQSSEPRPLFRLLPTSTTPRSWLTFLAVLVRPCLVLTLPTTCPVEGWPARATRPRGDQQVLGFLCVCVVSIRVKSAVGMDFSRKSFSEPHIIVVNHHSKCIATALVGRQSLVIFLLKVGSLQL